jgi:histidinol-phosphate phosphatase family protein
VDESKSLSAAPIARRASRVSAHPALAQLAVPGDHSAELRAVPPDQAPSRRLTKRQAADRRLFERRLAAGSSGAGRLARRGMTSRRRGRENAKVIFIDRDGVINHDPIGDYVKSWEEFEFIPGALEALKILTKKGFSVLIVSNQAGIGDGVYSQTSLDEITEKMLSSFRRAGARIHSVHYCVHGKEAGCECRKPKTGLFQRASRGLTLNRKETFFIGDKATDIQAGKDFGLRTVLVRTGHGERDLEKNPSLRPDYIAADLREAVRWLVGK